MKAKRKKPTLDELNTKTQTKTTQKRVSTETALQMLKNGNKRFVAGKPLNRDLAQQMKDTSEKGQFPFATILSCIDSRVSSEIIFDQGIGDIFSIRIAGNFINTDILGSMEFATKLAGTKIVVVLGHTACGAVKGSIGDAQIGNLGAMVAKIRPAVNAIKTPKDPKQRVPENAKFVNSVVKKNVQLSVQRILNESTVMAKLVADNKINVVGAVHDLASGKVTFIR